MNRERIVAALCAVPEVVYDREYCVLDPLARSEAEALAPTVEALIREAVREALTEVATQVRVATDGMNLHDDWPDGMLQAADMLEYYRDEHYPEP